VSVGVLRPALSRLILLVTADSSALRTVCKSLESELNCWVEGVCAAIAFLLVTALFVAAIAK
jgi:hypothetical protein